MLINKVVGREILDSRGNPTRRSGKLPLNVVQLVWLLFHLVLQPVKTRPLNYVMATKAVILARVF